MQELMLFDSVGLGYTRGDRGTISVHYPRRNKETGEVFPGEGGMLTFAVPERYWTNPPNDATRERAELWRRLLDRRQ